MTAREWNDYIATFRQLKNSTSGNSTFEKIVQTHFNFTQEAHGGSQFLPWHREYLFQVECLLRQINSDVTIPYWDWSNDISDLAVAPVWRRVGGARRGPSPIPNQPFRGWSSSVTAQHLVARDFDSGVSQSISASLNNEAALRNLVSDASRSFSDFSATLEGIHGTIHVAIGGSNGGDMGNPDISPNDPVFFLHHAFVDKLWNDYQQYPGKRREYNAIAGTVTLNDRTAAWNVTVGEMFARDNCVSYESSQRSAPASRQLRRRIRSLARQKQESDEDIIAGATPEPEATAPPAEDLRDTRVYMKALKNANDEERKKLMKAPKDRAVAIARRITKNQYLREAGRQFGISPDIIHRAEMVLAKEDPTIQYNEVMEGSPP